MKKKEINLSPEEIDYLLKGTIHWEDILSQQQNSLRKPLDIPQKGRENTPQSWDIKDFKEIKEQKELRNLREPRVPKEFTELKGWDFRQQDSSPQDFSNKENRPPKGSQEVDSRRPLDDEEENDLPVLSGTKVYALLSLMACIVFGTWIYFVFA